jgi:hypothetical protein
MAAIRVKFLGNEGDLAVVEYGGKTYYCRFGAFGNVTLQVGSYYTIDHSELFAR